jgi:hypothetical protein
MTGQTTIEIEFDTNTCSPTTTGTPEINDFVNAGLSYLPYIMINSLYKFTTVS